MDADYTPGIMETPSLLTPNISDTSLYKSTCSVIDEMNNNTTLAAPMKHSITDNESSEAEVSKIKDDLRQSIVTTRKPTKSPFFRSDPQDSNGTGVTAFPLPPIVEDGTSDNVPTTAQVMDALESFEKTPTKESTDREADPMGVIVSPKKRLIYRSQSHIEPTSPTAMSSSQLSQPQSNQQDEDSSIDDNASQSIAHHFQRSRDALQVSPKVESIPQTDHHVDIQYSVQARAEMVNVHPANTKHSQVTTSNNKRVVSNAIIGAPLNSKTSTFVLSQGPVINEVTSSDSYIGSKRQKTGMSTVHTVNIRSAMPTSSNNRAMNSTNHHPANDDQRKQQVRDSNREAARRCRERRRQYIEELEGNLEKQKTQIKQLTEKLALVERENTQLHAILTEANIFQSRRS